MATEEDVKVFSFDVDGTLVSKSFTDAVWLRGIPEAYAEQKGLSIEDAYAIIKSDYERVGDESIEWYRIDYWLRKYGLELTPEELFTRYRNEVHVYEDVEHVLKELRSAGYDIVISSNATMEFIEFQIPPVIRRLFSHIFSATSHFGEVKKSNSFYTRVCQILNVEPHQMVHVGDHWVFDFLNPREIGINAYFLDRSGSTNKWHRYIINSLEEVLKMFGDKV